MPESTSPIDNKHPLFGWNNKLFLDLSAANGNALTYSTGDPENTENLISEKVERPGGLQRIGIIARLNSWVDGGTESTATIVLEGSNDGLDSDDPSYERNPNDHWNIISSLSINNLFDGPTGQEKILGAAFSFSFVTDATILLGDPNIDVRRYRYLRVRAAVVNEDTSLDFVMDVEVFGIGGDKQRFDLSQTATQPNIPPTSAVNRALEPFTRPAGIRYMTCQVVAENIVLDDLSGYNVILEGALEEEGPYFALSITVAVTGLLKATGDTHFFLQSSSGSDLIDMDPFNWFRYRIQSRGAAMPGNGDLYTLTFLTEFDSRDVLSKSISQSDLQPDLAKMFYRVVFGEPTQPGGPGTDVFVNAEIQDITGNPVRGTGFPPSMYMTLSDELGPDGIVSPSSTAVFTGLGPVNVFWGIGTPVVLAKPNSDGIIPLTISNGAVVSEVYLQAVQFAGAGGLAAPTLPGRLLIFSEIQILNFP
jgi:hypothetical protein